MLQNTLSLQVDHDRHQVLVNPAGDRTQLQHMGRHLYLIACPSEHSLSPCFTGSLSQVSFLPADKELHEQRLAYRSSSSSDLDEVTSKHQLAQDSLQPVLQAASAVEDAISFQHVTSKDEVAAKGGEPKVSFYPKPRQPQPLAT